MNYAPILITVYDRIDHLRQCINSLLACPEARFSTLYIASDAASDEKSKHKIESVRSFLITITGFKNVVLILRPFNVGAVENSKLARAEVFKVYDRLIRMEDDVIVGNGFLFFINNGLELYKDECKILYICGYLSPGINHPGKNSFFLRTMTPYGFGMWRQKENVLEKYFDNKIIGSYFKSIKFFTVYEKLNPHCALALPRIINDGWMPGDIVRGILMVKNGYLALFPPTAISKSIGHDGSGIHSAANENLQKQEISHERYNISSSMAIQQDIELEIITAKYWRTSAISIKNYFFYIFKIKYPSLEFVLNYTKKIAKTYELFQKKIY